MSDRRLHDLMLLRFAPVILLSSVALFFLLLVWTPVTPTALLLAMTAGIWGFVTIVLQILTGWWFGWFGLIGWLPLLKASTAHLPHEDVHSIRAAMCMVAFGSAIWMLLLLIFRSPLTRFIDKRLNRGTLAPRGEVG